MKRLIVTASVAVGLAALIAISTPQAGPQHQEQNGKTGVSTTQGTDKAQPLGAEDEALAQRGRGGPGGGGFGGPGRGGPVVGGPGRGGPVVGGPGRGGPGEGGPGRGGPVVGGPGRGGPGEGGPGRGGPVVGGPGRGGPGEGGPGRGGPVVGGPGRGGPVIGGPGRGQPPIEKPPVGTTGHPPVGQPGGPVVHPDPIKGRPGGPVNGGVHIGKGQPPDIFRGGKPNRPWQPIGRVPGQREPVRVGRPYPGQWHPLPRYDYCNGFRFGGVFYIGPYPTFFGYGGWGPTEWIYDPIQGLWWSPTLGWVGAPPVLINDPITVAVVETVPVLDAFGNQEFDPITGDPLTETITVYYNAYFDPVYGAYGYQNSDGEFVWLRW